MQTVSCRQATLRLLIIGLICPVLLIGCAGMPSSLEKPDVKEMLDLNWREIAIFAPLVIVVIWMGVYPSFFLDVIHASVDQLLVNYHAALEAAPLEITIGAGR